MHPQCIVPAQFTASHGKKLGEFMCLAVVINSLFLFLKVFSSTADGDAGKVLCRQKHKEEHKEIFERGKGGEEESSLPWV